MIDLNTHVPIDYELIVTGEKWVGKGNKRTQNTIYNLIDNSQQSLLLTIYMLTNYEVFKKIKSAAYRGVNVEIFIHTNDDFYLSVKKELEEIGQMKHVSIFPADKEEFIHAKVLISDRSKILIGSANLTKHGLSSNYELGILIDNQDIAYKVEDTIKRLDS